MLESVETFHGTVVKTVIVFYEIVMAAKLFFRRKTTIRKPVKITLLNDQQSFYAVFCTFPNKQKTRQAGSMSVQLANNLIVVQIL